MTEEFDFEKYWLKKFSKCIDEIAGEDIRKEILAGSENFTDQSGINEKFKWSREAIEKLDFTLDEKKRIDVMTGCACQYPKEQLRVIKEKYEETKDLDLAHQMLQEKFENFLKNSLHLVEENFNFIVNRGWGLAGIKKKN